MKRTMNAVGMEQMTNVCETLIGKKDKEKVSFGRRRLTD